MIDVGDWISLTFYNTYKQDGENNDHCEEHVIIHLIYYNKRWLPKEQAQIKNLFARMLLPSFMMSG